MKSIDSKLLEACKKGEQKAQFTLYKRCFDPLIRICHRFANNRDDAVMLYNEAFYKILQGLDKLNDPNRFASWARHIMMNHCINEYKKKQTRSKYEASLPAQLENFALYEEEEEPKVRVSIPELREQIKDLPDRTQEVFQLFVLDECSHQEISDALDISVGTSKWHVNQARKQLREWLKRTVKSAKAWML
ncbi:sigma-70 family RNA polymerase sigma factor [bacterium SCSIO 12741]|nr:sigma-70 family RNA polymerase sigma factor [bacterium SCSIO 12741]